MNRYKDKSKEFKIEIRKLLIERESNGFSVSLDHAVKMRNVGDTEEGSVVATGGENKFYSNPEIFKKIQEFLTYIEDLTMYGD